MSRRAGGTLMVGFGAALLAGLAGHRPERSVVVLEEPDIVRKRNLVSRAATTGLVRHLVEGEYIRRRPGAALRTRLREDDVEAVVPALEYSVPAAADLAERWGLPGAGTAAAAVFSDKLDLRALATDAGVPGPAAREVASSDEFVAAASALGVDGAGLVLKPANRAGSVGVQMIDGATDLAAAWAATVSASDSQLVPDRELAWRFLVERRMTGPEISVECLVAGGEVVFTNVTDKLTAPGPYPVELGHVVPGPVARAHRPELDALVGRLVAASGFDTGVLHSEWILTADGPGLVECAARIPGDRITELVGIAHGFPFLPAYLDLLAGRSTALPAEPAQAVAIRFLHTEPGEVVAVDGVDRARAMPGVREVGCSASAGDVVGPLRSSWDRIGSVIATADDPATASRRAEDAARTVVVRTR